MLNVAMVFLGVGVIAWAAYWAGVPGVPIQISWMLSGIGTLVLIISEVTIRTHNKLG